MQSFWDGFEKRASVEDAAILGIGGALIGTTLGGIGGAILFPSKYKEFVAKLKNHGGVVDAKDAFKKIKHLSPETELYTYTDLKDLAKKEKDPTHKAVYTVLAKKLEDGNAGAIHPINITPFIKANTPKRLTETPVIICGDKVHPDVLAHEMGHIIDFDEVSKKGRVKKFLDLSLTTTVSREERAWDKAPGATNEFREGAVGTYKTVAKRRNFSLAVAALGGIAGALMGKSASQLDEWVAESGEVKKKRERNDTDPVELSSGFTPDTYRRGAFT